MNKKILTLIAAIALFFLPLANADLLDTYSVGFDFGNGAVETGYIEIATVEVYNPTIGYGWVTTSGMIPADRGLGNPNQLQRDWIRNDADFTIKTFQVSLPNGYYNVTVSVGDYSYAHVNTSIYLQNNLVSTLISTDANVFNVTTYTNIEVTNGYLYMGITATDPNNWCLNYMVITATEDPTANPAATENIFYTAIIFAVICLNLAVGWISKGWVVPATFGIISISIAVATLFTTIYAAIIFSPWLQLILLCVAIFNLYGVVLVARK